MAKHVMVDIETLGVGFDSVIASIGVVQFNPNTGHIGAGKEWRLSVDDGAKLGFKMYCDTVEFWNKQSEEAQKQLNGVQLVRSVMLELLDWFYQLGNKGDIEVWGNGPGFDQALLRTHFERMDYELPWEFWNERCVRTMVMAGRAIGVDPKKTLTFEGVEHSALDDAKHQDKYVSEIWQALGLNKKVKAA